MLIISIISTVVWLSIVPFLSLTVASAHYTRMTVMVFFLSLVLGTFLNVDMVEIYHSLFNYTPFSMIIDSLLYVVGILALVCFSPLEKITENVKSEYSLIFMFSILGASMMISAQDIISIYVALELQSFGLYILACMRTDQTGSTHASLKYFLLGAISSAFILLGISIIYQEVGSTEFQNIHSFLISYSNNSEVMYSHSKIIALGLLSMLCGFMFKISAAPFHSWFSDVIQGVPTYTSMIIMNLPKISVFTFLFNILIACGVISSSLTFVEGWNVDIEANYLTRAAETFFIIVTLFSLILGTVAGLRQTKMKRLLAFSTISHVGFILIAFTTGSEASLSAIIFYVVQYTLTVVVTFLALVAYERSYLSSSMNYIVDLQGTGQSYKLLTFTLVLCLFSIAGIPPLTGFYAKLGVLNSSILSAEQISLIFITAIICSVISAAYYLKVIKVLMFDTQSSSLSGPVREELTHVSPLHSYTMAVIMAFLCLFILDPELIINCTELVALSLYIT